MLDKYILKEIGKRITAFRESKNLSKQNFADRCGLSVPQVLRMERGERNFGIKILLQVLENFDDLSADWLLKGEK